MAQVSGGEGPVLLPSGFPTCHFGGLRLSQIFSMPGYELIAIDGNSVDWRDPGYKVGCEP